MPKTARKRGNATARSDPYGGGDGAPAAAKVAKARFKMNTGLGQHILKNPGIAQAIVDKADLKQSDVVLEVGPGTGNLTIRMLDRAKRVIAVERDERMAAEVVKRVQGTPAQHRLEVLTGDVIKRPLPAFDVCVSNTPYQISSPLVFKLLAMRPAPRACVLMFQREFAQRLCARPGDALYGRLAANAQMWARIEHVMKVGRANFAPPPMVESSVVRIVPKVPRPRISYEEWDGLLNICFVRGGRTLRSNFLGSRTAMEMIEANYRTWCAQNDLPLEDGPVEEGQEGVGRDDEEEEWGGLMDVDDEDEDIPDFFKEERERQAREARTGDPKRKRKGKIAELVRSKVQGVLVATELAQKRSNKCDETDFLRLLYEFNKEGIHFS